MMLLPFLLLVLIFTIMAFGNGPAMLPLFQKTLVEDQGILSVEQMLYAFAISQVTPGQANLFVTSIGFMLFGLGGALLATLAMVSPAYLMLPLMRGYERVRSLALVRRFTRGLTSASVGLILAATVQIGRSSLTQPIGWFAFVLTLALCRLVRWKPLPSLLTASATGMVLLTIWRF
jgi:chromate transporter